MEVIIPDELMARFSEFVAGAMGLHFPPSRWGDLRRGIVAATNALGFENPIACAQWLMGTPLSKDQLEILASNLTVGETYFFRDSKSFEIFSNHLLKPLILARQKEKRLRIWSAACCTGEEPYSIAIVLHRLIPDLQNWNITLLASDINSRFLRKAEAGVFGNWSFRDAPAWLKEGYFRAVGDERFEIIPEIRRMVRFMQLNLVDDVYPSLANDTNAMDVIFCRNVLMYFSEQQTKKVVHNLYRAQANFGWLIVSPSELLHMSSTPYLLTKFQDAMLYQKDPDRPGQSLGNTLPLPGLEQAPPSNFQSPIFAELNSLSPAVNDVKDAQSEAVALYEQGRYEVAAGKLDDMLQRAPDEPAPLNLLARSLANQGKLAEALACCDRWVAADKLNPSAHYLRAMVLQEQGELEAASRSLRQTLYLDPDFALAHFAMSMIARGWGDAEEADRHLINTLVVLRRCKPDVALPESEGITAGRLAEIVNTLMKVEMTA